MVISSDDQATARQICLRSGAKVQHFLSLTGMGGAYLTLLNTIANMGVILPKTPLFAAMDLLTISSCRDSSGKIVPKLSCPKKLRELGDSNMCTDAGK